MDTEISFTCYTIFHGSLSTRIKKLQMLWHVGINGNWGKQHFDLYYPYSVRCTCYDSFSYSAETFRVPMRTTRQPKQYWLVATG